MLTGISIIQNKIQQLLNVTQLFVKLICDGHISTLITHDISLDSIVTLEITPSPVIVIVFSS